MNFSYLDELGNNQHCILFTSEPHVLEQIQNHHSEFRHMKLSVCLRSTNEIAKLACDWASFDLSRKNRYIECKSGNYFFGEKPDINHVSLKSSPGSDPVSSFIEECVSTIKNYAYKSAYHFLPVIVDSIKDEILEQIIAGLTVENHPAKILCKIYQCTSEDFNQMLNSKQPTVWFIKVLQAEGAEFPEVVLLMCNIYELQLEADQPFSRKFFSAITRASRKVVIVRSTGYTQNDKEDEENLQRTRICEYLQEKLDLSPSFAPKIVIIGIIKKLMGLKKISEVYKLKVACPKIKSIQLFEGPKGGLFFQLDDICRKEDVKELHSFGITDVIIMGDIENFHFSTLSFFQFTEIALKSDQIFNKFKIFNYYWYFYYDYLVYNASLNTYPIEKAQKLEQSAIETFLAGKTGIPTSGPSSKWENWKEKATELYRSKRPFDAFKAYKNSVFFLDREKEDRIKKGEFEAAITDEKEMAKLKSNLSKMCISCLVEEDHSDEQFELEHSFESCILEALSCASSAIDLHPYWAKGYERLKEVQQMINHRDETGNNQFENIIISLQKLIEQDVVRGVLHGLRGQKIEFPENVNVLLQLMEIEEKRQEYVKGLGRLQLQNMIDLRIILADSFSNLALESFTAIKKAEPTATDRIFFIQRSARKINECTARYALESLEWNPGQDQSRQILSMALSALSDWLNEYEALLTTIGQEKFYQSLIEEIRTEISLSQVSISATKETQVLLNIPEKQLQKVSMGKKFNICIHRLKNQLTRLLSLLRSLMVENVVRLWGYFGFN